MRIERIEFQAIGPFADYFDIDLNQLGDSALFLIDGPTGAGKSTILDAITYAIYGDTSGSESDKSRMRSQYAAPTQDSYVRVTFSTPNGTYRIKRSPDFEKTKSRGEGKTKVNGTAKFEKLDGSNKWITEFEQVKDSAAAALEAVGLTKAQFAQTVLLPQGEFDKFLKSESKDRQDLLSRIFNTGRFTRLRESLKAQSRQLDLDLSALNVVVAQRAITICTIFNMGEEDTRVVSEIAEDIAKGDELSDFFEGHAVRVNEALTALKTDLAGAEGRYKSATDQLDLRKRELAAKNALDQAKSDAESTAGALTSLLSEAVSQAESHKFPLLEAETWQTRAEKVAASIARLSDLLETENSINSRREDAQAREEKLSIDRAQLAVFEGQSKSLPKEKEKLQDEKKVLKPEVDKLGALRVGLESLNQTAETISSLEKLKTDLPTVKANVKDATEMASIAEQRRHDLVASRLANMAGLLALDLKVGEPCAVCGSLQHPKPKELEPSSATGEEIEAAEEEAKKRSKLAEAASLKLTALESEIDAISRNLKVKPDEFEQIFAKAKTDLENSEEASVRLVEVESDIQDFADKIHENQTLKSAISTSIATEEVELQSLAKSIEKDSQKISTQASPFATISEKLKATQELAGAISEVLAVERAFNSKSAAVVERQKDFDHLAQSKDFAMPDSAQALVDETKPIYEDLLIRKSELETSLENYTPARQKLDDAVSERTKLLSGTEQIKNLAKIVDGDNPFRQPIDTFVLQSMFRQVLAAGNLRFQNLLEGRYSFELDEVGSDKRLTQGLGLSVRDRNTGETRNTKTLSGGEAFCASLSLALGLSDIVRAESGGLAIDTFFIDEGFGSLDGERLNQVSNMLSRLQAEGRTIGLISHVAEMKESINEKIDVKPSKSSGPSSLKVNWMPSST